MRRSAIAMTTAPRCGASAARVLVDEVARRPAPKRCLLWGAPADSRTLKAALAVTGPGDRIAVVPATCHADRLRQALAGVGRATVHDSLGSAPTADVVIAAEPLAGSEGEARAALAALRQHVAAGGVLVAGAPAPARTPAAAELERQASAHAVSSDLALRQVPPLRIHRLRFDPPASAGDVALAERIACAQRTSSIPLGSGRDSADSAWRIDSNGVAASALLLGASALLKAALPRSRLWMAPAVAAAPTAAFFRDPDRRGPDDPSAIVAASDGRVLSVETVTDDRFAQPGARWLRVAVFLSVLDVHVNRAPTAGVAVDAFVEPGGAAAAMLGAAEGNLAAYTVLESAHGRVAVAQRVGIIARRIVTRIRPGATLARGERFGLIRFGSRTDVYLPADRAVAEVSAGDRVAGGATVIARWREGLE